MMESEDKRKKERKGGGEGAKGQQWVHAKMPKQTLLLWLSNAAMSSKNTESGGQEMRPILWIG